MHAHHCEWHPEVHVQGLNEEARQRIMAIEELLHHFGVRTEAREQEIHQWLVDSQVAHADLVKDAHELRQFTTVNRTRQIICNSYGLHLQCLADEDQRGRGEVQMAKVLKRGKRLKNANNAEKMRTVQEKCAGTVELSPVDPTYVICSS